MTVAAADPPRRVRSPLGRTASCAARGRRLTVNLPKRRTGPVSHHGFTKDPFGNGVATSGALTSNLGFSGEYRDAETGLIYLRARYYDPTTAQFLTLDPAVPDTLSPYAYVAGNPLNATDPSGLCLGPVAVWCGAIALGALEDGLVVIFGTTAVVGTADALSKIPTHPGVASRPPMTWCQVHSCPLASQIPAGRAAWLMSGLGWRVSRPAQR